MKIVSEPKAQNINYNWKISIGGDGGVGKTTFIHKYLTHKFMSDTKLTIGIQFHYHVMERHGMKLGINLWDLGGQEQFRVMLPHYVKGSIAAFVFFDLSRYSTLLSTKKWINIMKENTTGDIPIVLVGTKLDLVDPNEIGELNQAAQKIVSDEKLQGYLVLSSKTGENVEEPVEKMVDLLLFQATGGKIGSSRIPMNV